MIMEFNVTLKRKVSEGSETVLTFIPVDKIVFRQDEMIVAVPVSTGGFFVDRPEQHYKVTIEEIVPEEPAP
jgi:hypothetical protein